ncbi:uncharacterized protein BKA55DRAFT_536769 [Fusarium redolens]|uniref:RNase III domain-containing protein n=1 Tax=Fusarium redolens TaxID=48865 RepID=A0A9P9HKH7_FUSRE|nr:uncharacterized protein BKA55DRAFT_536769 [Fusarium redolens]KAH7259066.1 hypothetical protein BKA55DRAFT_536769 [Fusarium redolens]
MTFCPRFSRRVSECESIIAYEFSSKTLCAQALNTAVDAMSVCILDGSFKAMPKNDRLAVYGDSAAASYLCSLWIKRGLAKHCWTTLRRDPNSNDNLAQVGMGHGLDRCINMNGGTTRVSSGMVATAVEAILGAVDIDGGRDALARVMNHLGLTQHALLSWVPSQLPWNSPVISACDPGVCLGRLLKKGQERILCQLGCHWSSLLTFLKKPFRQAPWIMDWGDGETGVAAE